MTNPTASPKYATTLSPAECRVFEHIHESIQAWLDEQHDLRGALGETAELFDEADRMSDPVEEHISYGNEP